jgi:hypothetical protein
MEVGSCMAAMPCHRTNPGIGDRKIVRESACKNRLLVASCLVRSCIVVQGIWNAPLSRELFKSLYPGFQKAASVILCTMRNLGARKFRAWWSVSGIEKREWSIAWEWLCTTQNVHCTVKSNHQNELKPEKDGKILGVLTKWTKTETRWAESEIRYWHTIRK